MTCIARYIPNLDLTVVRLHISAFLLFNTFKIPMDNYPPGFNPDSLDDRERNDKEEDCEI